MINKSLKRALLFPEFHYERFFFFGAIHFLIFESLLLL